MSTLEQKIDIILRYITTDDETEKAYLKVEAFKALESEPTPAIPEAVSARNEISIDDIIEELLKEIGIPYHLLGRDQIACAIKLAIEDDTYVNAMTRRMYPTVAERCNSTSARVERSIRHAINCVWQSRDLDNAYALFGNTLHINRGKPTNSEFLAACAKEVKRRMKYVK